MKKLLLLISCLVFSPLLPAAETAGSATPSFKFTLFSLDAHLEELYFRDGKKFRTLEAPSDYLDAPIFYRGGDAGPLQLFLGTPPSDKEPPPVPIAIIQPERRGNYLVLLKKSQSTKYQSFLIEIDDLANAPNSWNFVNLCDKPVLGVFDKYKVQVLPGKSASLSLGDKEGYLKGELFTPGKDRWQLAYTTRFYHQPKKPRTYFLLPSPSSPDRIKLKGLATVITEAEEKPPGQESPSK